MPDRLKSRRPTRSDVPRPTPGDSPTLSGMPAQDFGRPVVAASVHPASSSATNPNRAKRKGAKLPQATRTSVKRDGVTRSGVTVMRVDPATLKRSTAGGRNTSDRVLNSADVLARNVLSRRSIRKTAVSA